MHQPPNVPGISRYARVLLTVLALFTSIAQAVIPTPIVTGPIPSDTPGSPGHNYTFWATDIVLQKFGFVEQEFFFDGTANRYDAAAPGGGVGNVARCSPIANIVTPNIPYRSRMRVIRPTDPARFNGTVVVEWTNVTNGYDTPVWWLKPKAFYLREGYAYVEVSAQNAGLNNSPNGLRNWSPTRYGSLNVNGGGTQTGDVLSYDIFSQAAAAVRNVPAVLGGLPVQVVIGVGESQSAGRLGVYANAVHSRDPIYDGIIMSEGGEIICNNGTTPVMKVLSETEFAGQTNEIATLQPDTDKFRMWPVAGQSHCHIAGRYPAMTDHRMLLCSINSANGGLQGTPVIGPENRQQQVWVDLSRSRTLPADTSNATREAAGTSDAIARIQRVAERLGPVGVTVRDLLLVVQSLCFIDLGLHHGIVLCNFNV